MRLIAQKPCSFGGKSFLIGDEIPSEYVINPKAQEKMGVLAITSDAVKFAVPIHAEEGDFTPLLTNEELNVFTDILQIGVKTTEDKQKISEMIQNIESEDLLIVLHALDGRKYVVEEAMTRAQALSPFEPTVEETTEDEDTTDGAENPDGVENPEGAENPGGDE